MGKRAIIIMAALLLLGGQTVCKAERKNFEDRTVLYKGEHVAALGISYMNIGSNNSDILLTITNVDAKGSILKLSPTYYYAYQRNQAAGIRLNYTTIQGGAENISLDLMDLLSIENVNLDLKTRSVGGTIFHRSYFGLDRKGNCGLYLEVGLGYKNSRTTMSPDSYTKTQQVRFNFAPGFILYILPYASLNVQLGMANLSYNTANCYKDGVLQGGLDRWKGGVGLNILDLMFGVNFHF